MIPVPRYLFQNNQRGGAWENTEDQKCLQVNDYLDTDNGVYQTILLTFE